MIDRRAACGVALVALLTVACDQTASTQCDPAAIRALQAARADHSEVTLCGTVVQVRRLRRSRSGTHRAFLVDVGGNDRIEIDANVGIMGDFPIHDGEAAVVRGEYYADPSGRDGVHWTHRTDRGTHPAGYIVLAGVTYR